MSSTVHGLLVFVTENSSRYLPRLTGSSAAPAPFTPCPFTPLKMSKKPQCEKSDAFCHLLSCNTYVKASETAKKVRHEVSV